jgi:hypothetical protein
MEGNQSRETEMPADQKSLRTGLVVFAFLWIVSSIGVQLQLGRLEDRLQSQIESVKKSIDQRR